MLCARKKKHRLMRCTNLNEPRKKTILCPILIKQRQEQYMPCDNQDLDELISHLPKIHEEADKWIKVLEEETTGKLFVIGDIKALLAKCLGVFKINDILGGVHLHQAIDNQRMSGTPFNKHRAEIWLALRTEYPVSLKAIPIGDTENPTIGLCDITIYNGWTK